MSDQHHEDHGHSLAAWVLVGLLMVAFALASLAVVMMSVPLTIAAVIIGVIGLVAGKVLASMGYGVAAKRNAAGH